MAKLNLNVYCKISALLLGLIVVLFLTTIVLIVCRFHSISFNDDQACEVNPMTLEMSPIFLKPSIPNIVYPTNDIGTIKVSKEDSIDILCPGGILSLNGVSIQGSFRATCKSGKLLGAKNFTIDYSTSCIESKSVAVFMPGLCKGGDKASIGFNYITGGFVHQIDFCFNKYNQTTLYTIYDILPRKSIFKKRPSWSIQDEGFFSLPEQNMSKLYARKSQRNTINRLLGLHDSDKSYIQDGRIFFLSRGHIAAAADFYYPSQINATYRYVNLAPQWQSINNGNWRRSEEDSRNYAVRNNVTLKVWSGTYGVARLPHANTSSYTALYLYVTDVEKKVPVPALFWKVLYNPSERKAIVLIVLNNPYINILSDEFKKQLLCQDISADVPWLTWNNNDIVEGYSYACNMTSFQMAVEYAPNLFTSGLLL